MKDSRKTSVAEVPSPSAELMKPLSQIRGGSGRSRSGAERVTPAVEMAVEARRAAGERTAARESAKEGAKRPVLTGQVPAPVRESRPLTKKQKALVDRMLAQSPLLRGRSVKDRETGDASD